MRIKKEVIGNGIDIIPLTVASGCSVAGGLPLEIRCTLHD